MLSKPFDQMDKTYIEALIADSVVEGKHHDYKEKLPEDNDKEKSRFAEDICSFANAAGGDIFFGLRDKRDERDQKTGAPEYAGLKGLSLDQDKLRLENMILNRVEPRIAGIQFRLVEGFKDGPVLIMRIPRSYNAPHMTKHDGRFRSRTDSGNYPMDVQEIRSAFIASETLPERIRRFRADRLTKIVADETPVPLDPTPKIVLHLLPVSSFVMRQTYDVKSVSQGAVALTSMRDPSRRHSSFRYNLDGLLSFIQPENRTALMYTQLYRDGRIEAVDAFSTQFGGDQKVFGRGLETYIVEAVDLYLAVQKTLGVEPPIVVMLTFLKVRGYGMTGTYGPFPCQGEDRIDRDDLIIDEAVVEDFGCAVERLMRPIFDAVWMACGWPGSPNPLPADGSLPPAR